MKNVRKTKQNREEDFLVKATLIVNGIEITGVPCKVYLPERINEKPYIILKPLEENATRIMTSHEGRLQANVYGFDKKKKVTIEAPRVYFLGGSTRYWGDGISDRTIPGEPQNLHIIHHLGTNEITKKTQIAFWISPNRFLTPFTSRSSSYNGEVKYKRLHDVEFTIKDEVKLVFEEHFHSKIVENGDFVQWSFLVACTELDIPADDVEILKKTILPDIDDFLLIASFAARQRTACLGWSANDKNSHATFYRGNYVFPEINSDISLNDEVINIQDFEKFMGTCYSAFLQYENKLALRSAIYSVLPVQPRTLETSFLSMFAGLETLILDFRRREGLEFVVSKGDWSTLKKYFKKCIKNFTEPSLNSEQRDSIYRKLDELNRVSLQEAFDLFCKKYSIYSADLWPVFGNKEKKIAGLVDIRNKLIHGDPFPSDLMGAIVVAKEHLIYILERALTRVLQWNINETKLTPALLKNNFPVINDMPAEQAKLSKYIYD